MDEDCGMKTERSDVDEQVPGGSVSILDLLPLSEPARLDFLLLAALYTVQCTTVHSPPS